MVTLFTDFSFHSHKEDLDNILQALQHLRYNGNEVLIFNVLDRGLEEEFNFGNRPHKFVDLETGNEIKMTPMDFKEKYQTEKSRQLRYIKEKLLNFGIEYIESDINDGFTSVLENYLVKGLYCSVFSCWLNFYFEVSIFGYVYFYNKISIALFVVF